MPDRLRVLTVYGTRPEAIKCAPIIHALEATPTVESIIAVTGQHREMLDQVHLLFDIRPDYDLELMQENQTLNGIASRVILGMDTVLQEARPDLVLVHGDTTSAMAAALSAFNRGIPIVHVEAGLRSGDLSCPFPEEANRKLIAQIARLHLAPTTGAEASLIKEGIPESNIVLTGNSIIDALQSVVKFGGKLGGDLNTNPKVREMASAFQLHPMVLVTMHRRENMGPRLVNVARAVATTARQYPSCAFFWPAHSKPGIYETIRPWLQHLENVAIVEPLMYHEFIHLVCIARVILTDSGGVQEEGVTVGTPVLVARDITDRSEALGAGRLVVVGTDESRIVKELKHHLDGPGKGEGNKDESATIFGDGHAAERSVKAILDVFGGDQARS